MKAWDKNKLQKPQSGEMLPEEELFAQPVENTKLIL